MAEGAIHKEPVQPLSPRGEWEEAQCSGWCSVPSGSCLQLTLGAPTISGFICRSMWGPVPWEMLLTSSGWEAGPWSGSKAWPKALPGLSACVRLHMIYCQSCALCWMVPGFVGIWETSQTGIYTSVPAGRHEWAINWLHMNTGSLP